MAAATTAPAPVPAAGDRAFALDAGTVVALSAAIALAADRLVLMSVLVPAVLLARGLLWARLPAAERGHGRRAELVLWGACTVLGAFNDWNSVVGHGIYDYTVPVFFPQWTTIPLWMLLFWGMILRLFVSVARWRRLDPPARPRDDVWFGRTRRSGAARLALLLGLTVATRQAIYRFYLDPLWSWAPFAGALVLYGVFGRPTRHEGRLVLAALVVGPLVEMLYINVGALHRYHLGWLGGVPLWIVLWWALALIVFSDLALRALVVLRRWEGMEQGVEDAAGAQPQAAGRAM